MKWLARSLKLLVTLAVLSTPVLGVWLASSLAAFYNGPIWIAVASGLLLFPLLPALWDLWAMRRRVRRGQKPEDRVLTAGDRLIVRTFVVNTLFLVLLLGLLPQAAFTALSTRGDWMLEGRQGDAAELARRGLFSAADGLEWLYLAYRDNPFEEMGEGAPPPPPAHDERGEVSTGETDDGEADDGARWPMPGAPHRLIAEIPEQERSSVEAVGRYLAEHERDPYQLVKALHDFSTTHVRYDFEALDAGDYPPQDAATVFRTGRGVCAGYANLLAALGDAAGMEVVYITGDSRDQGGEIGGDGHAWNAAKIEGSWYLIDATWDAGHREGGTFKQAYKTDYLFTPPRFFAQGHLPDDPAWQLLDEPLSRGEFMRQPMLDPAFHLAGLRLVSPTRSQVTVAGAATVEIANPEGKYLMLTYRDKAFADDTSRAEECVGSGHATVTATCDLPRSGTYLIMLFLNQQRFGTYTSVGQIEINRS